MLFRYWTVSYRPTPFSLDRWGLGVIIEEAQSGGVAYQFVDPKSVGAQRKAFSSSMNAHIQSLVKHLQVYCSEQEGLPLGQSVSPGNPIQEWSVDSNNALIIDPYRTMVAESVEHARDILFSRYVGVEKPSVRHQQLRAVKKRIQLAYGESDLIAPLLRRNPTVKSVGMEKHFDFSVSEEANVFEISMAFNFAKDNAKDLLNEVDAWTWKVTGIREGSGTLLLDGQSSISINRHVSIVAAIYPAESEQQIETYQKATQEWIELGVEVVDLESINDHARQLEDRIRAA